ncbi:ImmA/IrrE family metallo-endopeptidase [Patescibacteria group bacterium]|nr:ImmA/IrrE family metallo-endopeptidase [Patescibacteria group bacterium]
MKLNLRRLTDFKIGEIAQKFLEQHHPSLSLPIPIEEIAESKLNIEIIPIKTLKQDFDIDGCLDSTLSRIFIDFDLYINQENRTRFTIAHEVGHLALHWEIFNSLEIKSQTDLYKLVDNISNEDYKWLEYQAYSFAGHILVPTQLLTHEIKSRLPISQTGEVSAEDLYPVFPELIEKFNVSGEVLLRRLQKVGLVNNNKS